MVLQDQRRELHVHTREPLGAITSEWHSVIFYNRGNLLRREDSFQTFATIYVRAERELEILEANVPTQGWLMLVSYADGSRIWETPGQVFEWHHQQSGTKLIEALVTAQHLKKREAELKGSVKDLTEQNEDLESIRNNFMGALDVMRKAIAPVFELARPTRLTKKATETLLQFAWIFTAHLHELKPSILSREQANRVHANLYGEWVEAMRGAADWKKVLDAAKEFDLLDEDGRPKVKT